MGQGLTIRHVGLMVCCCATAGIPAAMLVSTPGIFYPAISSDLGVQTAEVSAWMSVAMIASAVMSPVVGNLIGRVGLRALTVSGVLMAAAAMGVFSIATAPWMLWLAGVGAGYSLVVCLSLVPTVLVNRWFAKHVGFLLGLYTAFTGIGGVTFLMVGQALIDSMGWRGAYGVFAVIVVAVCIPLALLFVRESPESCGLLPFGADGSVQEIEEKESADDGQVHEQVRATYRMPVFWAIFVFGFLVNMVCQTNGYFPKYVNWVNEQALAGLVPAAFLTGAVLSSCTQAGNAIGKIGLGAYSDFSVRQAMLLLAGCGALGMFVVWQMPATPFLAVGGVVFGFFLAGVLVLVPMMVRQVFGSGATYPLIYSRLAVAPTLGGAAGNIVWPWLADNMGGFDAVFGLAIVCIAVLTLIGLRVIRRA